MTNVTTTDIAFEPSAEAIGAVAQLRINPRIIEAATLPVFSAEECATIIAACDDDAWRDLPAPSSRSAERRKTEQPVPGGNGGWIVERIAQRITEINDEVYRFNLLGLEEPVWIYSYEAETGGFFDPHIDLSGGVAMRKLTFSLLLSDPSTFEGGDLGFQLGTFAEARREGAIAVFPSFLLHDVAPVTAGRRIAIVGWAVGPTFV